MLLVGLEGYHEKYNKLASAVDDVTRKISDAGMKIIHAHNRVKGSTAFSPEDPKRCQSGFLLSLTPHCLRQVGPGGGKPALDVFVEDLVECHDSITRKPSVLG